MHEEMPDTVHSFWMCSIVVDDAAYRQPLRDHLKVAGIETRPLFYPANTMPHCKTDEIFLIAESLSARGMNLPSYPGLVHEEVEFVCSAVRSFFQ